LPACALSIATFDHLGDEAVSLPRNGLDVPVSATAGRKRLSKYGDVVRQSAVVYHDVGPDNLKQAWSRKQPSMMAHESAEGIECLAVQRNRNAVTQEAAFANFEAERTEFEDSARVGHVSDAPIQE
jgi:hypothetical protein